ncbi:hypothetical protein EDC01DRAFT_661859 [Geopyxis carbonaria]|nr:hypothetical protein EDC01DRAFT_661859 [Geopyxis carbonaria]
MFLRPRSESAPVVTIDPPSRPITPATHPQHPSAEPASTVHLSPTLSHTSTFSDASSSYSDISSASSRTLTPSTLYHLYRPNEGDITVHTVPDSTIKASHPKPASTTHWWQKADPSAPPKLKLGDPATDPRSAAYYMHAPTLWGHVPPRTLRLGGRKDAPVVCLIDGDMSWRRWKLDFAAPACKKPRGAPMRADTTPAPLQSLNDPGVMDPRGVQTARYPLRSWSLPGESGKAWAREQRARRRTGVEIPDACLPRAPDEAAIPPHLRVTDGDDACVLLLVWNGWWTREYAFAVRGVQMRWKGTGTVRDEKKYWGSWCRYNHLKLVAYLPDADSEFVERERWEKEKEKVGVLKRIRSVASFRSGVSDAGSGSGSERDEALSGCRPVLLAKYTCIWANRKAGRLVVYEPGLEEVAAAGLAARKESRKGQEEVQEEEVVETVETATERLRHVVVATALCMLQGEKEKRDTLRAIAEGAAGAGGGG